MAHHDEFAGGAELFDISDKLVELGDISAERGDAPAAIGGVEEWLQKAPGGRETFG